MNRILTFILLFSISVSFAQNWQTINSKRIANYSLVLSDKTVFETVAIDSIEIVGSDSIFYNFKTFYGEDINWECENLIDTSWIGIQVKIDTLGNNFFTNKYGDEIQIKTLTDTGETWDFSPFITATVIQKSYDTILDNIMDSVKTISLSNGSEIIISKNYGLIKSIRFGYFPDDDREIVLAGIDEVGEIKTSTYFGLKASTGDEFHYSESGGDFDWFDSKYILKILAIDSTSSNLELKYKTERCFYEKGGGLSSESPWEYKNTDTIYLIYSTIKKINLSYYSKSDSLEDYNGGGYNYLFRNTKINSIQKYNEFDYSFNGGNCWYEIIDNSFSNIEAENLGVIISNSNSFGSGSHIKKLVYYKKTNGEEWGNSLGSCETLSNSELIQNQINIYPNPVTDVLNISNHNKLELNVEIYNSTGQQVYANSFLKSSQINTSDWQKGLYIIKINNSNGNSLKVEKFMKE